MTGFIKSVDKIEKHIAVKLNENKDNWIKSSSHFYYSIKKDEIMGAGFLDKFDDINVTVKYSKNRSLKIRIYSIDEEDHGFELFFVRNLISRELILTFSLFVFDKKTSTFPEFYRIIITKEDSVIESLIDFIKWFKMIDNMDKELSFVQNRYNKLMKEIRKTTKSKIRVHKSINSVW